MRCVAGVGLFALVGCNQIFSLGQTREFDAAIPIDVVPDLPHVLLTWQVAGVLPTEADAGVPDAGAPDAGAPDLGAPDPSIAFAAIVPAPLVRIAPLNGAFEAAEYSTDGVILIPRSYVGETWRLEYTLTDGISSQVPHEVQWTPEDKLGHLTVPLFGRVKRDALPQGGGYKVKPTGAPGYTCPWLVTSGLWTLGHGQIDPTDPTTVGSDLRGAIWLSGKVGRPDRARGDRAFLLDYVRLTSTGMDDTGNDCQVAVGSVTLDSADVQTGTSPQVPSQIWDIARRAVTSTTIGVPLIVRLQNQLGNLHTAVTGSVLFGSAPSTSMPGLAGALLGVTASGCGPDTPSFPPALPVPVMVPLVRCPYSADPDAHHPGLPLPPIALPTGLQSFPQILHVQLVDARSVPGFPGVSLPSGMEATIAADKNGVFPIDVPAPMPTRMALTTPRNGIVDLTGAGPEGIDVSVDPDSDVFQLDFTPEAGANLRADYHDVLLHRFAAGSLTTDRIYTVTAPTVRIAGSVLQVGAVYVLEIRTYKGHPDAARGDFATVDYPYGAAIVFTRTFKTSAPPPSVIPDGSAPLSGFRPTAGQ